MEMLGHGKGDGDGAALLALARHCSIHKGILPGQVRAILGTKPSRKRH